MRSILAPAFLLLFFAAPLGAQHAQPYAGQQHRPLKALSEAEVQGYLAGAGMGYGRVAELNSYPGPRHVLDLAEPLSLSTEQRRQTEEVFQRMRAEAVRLGEQVVAKEAELERLFAERQIQESSLREILREIAQLQGELRGTHLRAHLAMREILSPEQIARYDQLRGYSDEQSSGEHHHPGHRHQHR